MTLRWLSCLASHITLILRRLLTQGKIHFISSFTKALPRRWSLLLLTQGNYQTNKPLNKDWEWQLDSMITITTSTKIFQKAPRVAVAMVGRVDKLETGQTRCIWTILRLSIAEKDKDDLKNFYQTIIQVLGACDAHGLAALRNNYDSKTNTGAPTQRVVTNFLAIYTAEEYRAIQGTKNWDDAILEVTLLGAFHGGQTTFTKFYRGKFTTGSTVQETGNYYGLPSKDKNGKVIPTVAKTASMNDYWQISKTSTRSGIHLTAGDYSKMGSAITKYQSTKAHNKTLSLIQSIVGRGPNVIQSISRYFTDGKADPSKTNTLAVAVAEFLDQVNTDADLITAWEKGVRPSPAPPGPPPVALSKINRSVGRWDKGAVNTSADVSTVQRLLQTAAQKLNDPSLDPKGIDGKIAHVATKSHTVSAIQAFQTRSALNVTGLIEPHDETWTKLLAAAGETTP